MQRELLSGRDFTKMMASGLAELSANYKDVDSLNVFPVPDGDTGTNMYLTFNAAHQEITKSADTSSVTSIAEAASKGALMGARGNSGVILSQLLRGFAKGVKDLDTIEAKHVAEALNEGVNIAYKAVMKPVEGTILTVAREAAKEAMKAARTTDSPAEVLRQALIQAEETLNLTPEMLPALKEAGVVDAGGMGWLVILKGFYQGLTDQTIEIDQKPVSVKEDTRDASDQRRVEASAFIDEEEEDVFTFPYCTEVLVHVSAAVDLESIRKELADAGNSLLVVDSDGFLKVHIHSAHPGEIIETCLKYGSLKDVKINNMLDQAQAKKELEAARHTLPYAVISVASGDGLKEIMEDLGAAQVITGGQSMNPSIQEIVDAVNAIDADTVVILPNNSNIIMTANQVAEMTDKKVEIIPTKSVVQGISALLTVAPGMALENLLKGMKANVAHVKTGEITFSVRDTNLNGLEIKKGNILGLADGEISVVGDHVKDTTLALVNKMIEPDSEICSIYYGEEVTEAEARELAEELQNHYEDLEFELNFGGQPLYYYMISVE